MEETKLRFPDCPFCSGELDCSYSSTGTTLFCGGCGGEFTFPAFPEEVLAMWARYQRHL